MSDWERPIEALSSEGVKELRRLQVENAKLREDLEFERSENGWAREFLNRMGRKCGTKDCPSLVAYVTKLESDNAKLRELCGELADELHALGVDFDRIGWCFIRDELRNLGIEVDE